ncbi:MAG: enoyl-CoA hydratase/isomerase family protein [Candidatus Accumulibacter sp.]|uniref:enoyl-CoA hydratase/isomerase family protein n=1 Tax=Accumulibacter sp. TaxID=2053492 RepID=UPI001A384D6C|nr:enoyl-CoA hydratase-related protein [Accumulibacter sp.]MBL8390436.1 enoyl-CoA hydratase/isomerase family protein [Accumulibacter sp.]HRD88724.1 enoyl-CoA hydratase-related protein [Accumulibacter sp.]
MNGSVRCSCDGEVATITLSNPTKLNAVDSVMWRQLAAVVNELAADTRFRCLVLQGEGDQAFAAGGDIEEFSTQRDTVDRAMAYHALAGAALQAVGDCPLPTIALIRGACIGGGLEIAAQCDLRICGTSARLGAPINRLGFSMYPVEMQALLRLAGVATMRELLLEGRILGAAEALSKGLVTRVVADQEVVAEAYATARRVCQGAPLVARWHKQLLQRLQQDLPLREEELRDSFAFLETDDYREGLAAFLAKRAPRFRGC